MKYSILGTNGFLSTAIAKFCNQKGYGLDMYGLHEPIGHSYDNFYKMNLVEENIDMSTLKNSDVIIYAIGAGIQSNLNESVNLIYSLNVNVPINICNQLRFLGYNGRFVTFGSVFEIGETSLKHPFTEEELLVSTSQAPNDYTVSKRILSRFVESYKHDYTHWHFFIPTIYGEGENPMRLIPYTVSAIREGRELVFTSGEQVRQYIYVSEVPLIIDKCVLENVPSGCYNLEGNETLTVKEIVTLIHDVMGCTVPDGCFGKVKRKDVGMKYLALDGSKLKTFIPVELSKTISGSCKKYES